MGKAVDHGWLNDPSVKGSFGGAPPDGHVRRCQGRNSYLSKRAGHPVQCQRWALKGRRYCKRHGGRVRILFDTTMVKRWYSQYAGKTLKAKLEEMAAAPPDERVSLEGEIDIARVLALEAFTRFDKVCVEGEYAKTKDAKGEPAEPTEAQKREQHASAMIACREAMEFVSRIVEKAARVRSNSEGTIDLELTDYIIHQVTRAIERRVTPLKGGKRAVDLLQKDFAEIRLPEKQHSEKTTEETAAEVREMLSQMDATIMGVPADVKALQAPKEPAKSGRNGRAGTGGKAKLNGKASSNGVEERG